MKLEQQVCSLELAKKLKDLGVKQESWCYWVEEIKDNGHPSNPMQHTGKFRLNMCRPLIFPEQYSAFTVAELFSIYYELTGEMKADILALPNELANHLARQIIKLNLTPMPEEKQKWEISGTTYQNWVSLFATANDEDIKEHINLQINSLIQSEREKERERLKHFWYHAGQWHKAGCTFLLNDWGVCSCNFNSLTQSERKEETK